MAGPRSPTSPKSCNPHGLIAYSVYILYIRDMEIVTTTVARKRIKDLVDRVRYRGEVVGIGRRRSIDAVLIRFPDAYRKSVNDITNVNAYSRSFDFLAGEPELYSPADVH